MKQVSAAFMKDDEMWEKALGEGRVGADGGRSLWEKEDRR